MRERGLKTGAKGRGVRPLDLVATAAHEFKSPLVVIDGLAALLAQGDLGDLSAHQRTQLYRISHISRRLLRLVEGVMVINRAEHRPANWQLAPVSAAHVLDQVIKELEPAITAQRQSLKISGKLKLPALLVSADLLHQILYNLLDNAQKYAPPSSQIKLKFKNLGERVLIQISNVSNTIKPSEIKYLFERFGTHATPVRAQADSSGLGLFIVKQLVELMGGNINVKATAGGTCFNLQLPVAKQLDLFSRSV